MTVEIVAVDTDQTLMQWRERALDAQLLKEKIGSDLDQMDARQFAAEWGLSSASGGDEAST